MMYHIHIDTKELSKYRDEFIDLVETLDDLIKSFEKLNEKPDKCFDNLHKLGYSDSDTFEIFDAIYED